MTGHAQRSHRRFSPSQSERFFGCKGSTNLLKRVPVRPPTEYSIEGTKGHEVLEAALSNGIRDAEIAHRDYSSLCMEDLNTLDNGFYLSVNMALNYVYALLDEHPDAILYTERFVNPPSNAAPNETGGYCDVAVFIPSMRVLYIIDYKHGAGVAKAVNGNTQVMQYGCGFLYDENSPVNAVDVDRVILTIIQPRAFHTDGEIREHPVTPFELYEHLDEIDAAILQNLDPEAPLTPDDNGKTTDHCRFCDANTICPARQAKALSVVSKQFRTVRDVKAPDLPPLAKLTIDELAYIRLMAPMLRKYLDDVDNHIDELARQGHTIPGAKLVEVAAKREYYGDKDDVAKRAAALIGCDPATLYEMRLMPLTQVEKLVVEAFKKRVGSGKKNAAAADARKAFAYLTLKKSSGNLVLVDEDDPRPAVNRALNSFTQINAAALIPTPQQT